ncbi:MAG: hypothetical protein ACI4SZ_02375 [Lachnospiraceae bacterium]
MRKRQLPNGTAKPAVVSADDRAKPVNEEAAASEWHCEAEP